LKNNNDDRICRKRYNKVEYMDWLKNFYELVGTPYPRLSLFVVTILGALAAYSIWTIAASQVAKDHQKSTAPSQVSGPASTSGENSPAVTGDKNNFNYSQPSSDSKPQNRKE
jgi:hypothetical protein